MKTLPKFPHRLFIDGKGYEALSIVYEIPLEPGYALFVVGEPEMGWYEWVIHDDLRRQLTHSQESYGISWCALRDGLVAHWGVPDLPPRSVRDWIHIDTRTRAAPPPPYLPSSRGPR